MNWSRWERPVLTVLVLALAFGTCELGVRISGIPSYLLPSLSESVVTAFTEAEETLIPAALLTLEEALWGLFAATVVGITIGVASAESQTFERAVMPYVVASQAVPMLAIAPLLIMWFGFGLAPKIIATALICFFPIVVNTYAGIRSIERDIGNLMTSLQATRLQVLIKVKFPAAVPFIFAGFKNAVVFAVIGALAASNLKPFISKALVTASTPVSFQAPSRGPIAHGFRAELLPQVCEVYLKAREAGALLTSQEHIAIQAEVFIRALATVGVIALVDEVTGYQNVREKRALAEILEEFIAKELRPWTRTFPPEFYSEIFRLKDWPGPDGVKRPSVIGNYTTDLVYDRLAPGVLDELKKINPPVSPGRRRHKHHQWLTGDVGHPKLKEHLIGVMALMRAASNWTVFKRSLQRAYPKLKEQMPFDLGEDR